MCCMLANAQTANLPKTLKTWGYTMLYDGNLAPIYKTNHTEEPSGLSPAFSVITFSLGYRFPLYNFSNRSSLGLNVEPTAAFMYGLAGPDGRFNLPVLFEMGFGAMATNKSLDFNGIAYGLGINIVEGPTIQNYTLDHLSDEDRLKPLMPSIQLCAALKIRSWRTKRKPQHVGRELEILYSIGAKAPSNVGPFAMDYRFVINRPMQLSIIWRKYINY